MSFRIGLIAPEFPPQIGGMQEYAAGLAAALSGIQELILFTQPGNGIERAGYRQVIVPFRDLARDAARLEQHPIDVWYGLNCGLASLAPRLRRPLFVNCNGNDFLDPWMAYARRWESVGHRIPFLSRHAAALQRAEGRWRIRRGLRAVSGVFAISRAAAAAFERSFPGGRLKPQVVPCGVADDFLDSPPRTGRSEGPLRLLTVSRLTAAALRRKNVDGVLHAVARLGDRVPLHYTVVGEGEGRAELVALAAALGLSGRVTFRGQLSRAELLDAYRATDLFVLAAKATASDIEGFGIVYLEASACGVPVICSREGGSVDAVEEGLNGLVIDDSSPAAIAAAIESFAAARDRFPPEGVRAFAERHRWSRVAGKLSDLLAGGLSSRGRPATNAAGSPPR